METQMQPAINRRLNVGPVERGLSVAAGLAGIYIILSRRPDRKIGLPLAMDAGYMIYRGATGHCVFYQMMEINRSLEGNKGIQVQRAVTVNMPREQLYRIWRNFENLPRFMKHLQRVDVDEATDGKHSHWVAKAPFGREIQWDAEMTKIARMSTLPGGPCPAPSLAARELSVLSMLRIRWEPSFMC